MQPSSKSFLMLLTTLGLGVVLGAAAMAGFRPGGPLRPPPGGGPGGFIEHMERTIQPHDAAQRAAILPILEATDRRNRTSVESSRAVMRANLDSMVANLAPLLDERQRGRLVELTRRLGDPKRPGPEEGPPPPR